MNASRDIYLHVLPLTRIQVRFSALTQRKESTVPDRLTKPKEIGRALHIIQLALSQNTDEVISQDQFDDILRIQLAVIIELCERLSDEESK